ncbi:hypothetical protein [Mesorhizobium sp. M1396]|uniref:hypothetical protein n=1 Tax=unclassified Mesorhizobium TaxID=325217 RepID=UPI00333DD52F
MAAIADLSDGTVVLPSLSIGLSDARLACAVAAIPRIWKQQPQFVFRALPSRSTIGRQLRNVGRVPAQSRAFPDSADKQISSRRRDFLDG